jgi:D-glycero-alpha-D-manno-heptose 1-phosphate guanylyltransferase
MDDFPLVLILAGGFATRLKSVFSDRPKALAETNGIPFLDIQLQWLEKQGAKDIVLLTGFKAQQITSYLRSRSSLKMNLNNLTESIPLGTGGAIINAVTELCLSKGFLIINGDSLVDVDLSDFSIKGKESNCAWMVTMHQENSQRFGTVEFDEDYKLIGFQEKNKNLLAGWINAGIYYFPEGWFDGTVKNKYPVSLEQDLIPQWLLESRIMKVFPTHGNFIDIGTPESFSLFQQQGHLWD